MTGSILLGVAAGVGLVALCFGLAVIFAWDHPRDAQILAGATVAVVLALALALAVVAGRAAGWLA